jgi:hypothetical protein
MSFLKRFIKQDSKSEKDKDENKGRLYFHEDLYCQVELLPRENFSEIVKENEKIEDFAQKHSDGFGYTDIYVRNGQKIKTSERKIQNGDFEKVMLESGFKKYSNVYSGYSSYEEPCKNTMGFKLDSSVVYCDFENDLIKNIWIDNFRFSNSSDKKEQLINSLFAIGEKWNLILNDWDLTETFDLMNKAEIERYISEE